MGTLIIEVYANMHTKYKVLLGGGLELSPSIGSLGNSLDPYFLRLDCLCSSGGSGPNKLNSARAVSSLNITISEMQWHQPVEEPKYIFIFFLKPTSPQPYDLQGRAHAASPINVPSCLILS